MSEDELTPGGDELSADGAAEVANAGAAKGTGKTTSESDSMNVFARFALFLRQVIDELRKVIWPTRRELITYTGVVLFFCAVMAAYIAGLDALFTKAVLLLFGRS